MKAMIISDATMFMRDNLTSAVVRLGTRHNGKLFYRLENGLTYEIDESGRATLDRFGFTPRLSAALQPTA